MRYLVSLGKEVAFNTEVEVEAESPEEAEEFALALDIDHSEWEEGDWESSWHIQEVEEVEEDVDGEEDDE